MKLKQIAISIGLCLFILPAFSQNFYIDDIGTTTFSFAKKGDLKLVAIAPFRQNANYHIGYSPFKYLFVISGFYHSHFEQINENYFIKTIGKVYTSSIGGYFNINSLSNRNLNHKFLKDVRLEVQFGYSGGNVRNNIDPGFTANLDFQNTFFKYGLTYQFRFIEISAFNKFNHIQYLDGFVEGGNLYPYIFDQATKINQEEGHKFMETHFQISFGIPELRFFLGGSIIDKNKIQPLFSNRKSGYVGLFIEIDNLLDALKK